MLARIKKAFCSLERLASIGEWERSAFEEKMNVIAQLLDGLIDYSGLYPPAALDMPAVVRNYDCYRQERHAFALGKLVVDLNRVEELRKVAGESLQGFRLNIIASGSRDVESFHRFLDAGLPIEAIEMKASAMSPIEQTTRQLPMGLATYFEVPVECADAGALDAICAAGTRVKLRLGGLTAEAFPSPHATACMLHAIARRHLLFKATAGLHHPVRARRPFTDAPDSAVGTMHGFVNLCSAAALLHLGGDVMEAMLILAEMDRRAWQVSTETITWRELHWSVPQMQEVRQEFFCGIGSCSFTQPIEEMEAFGWL